MRELYLSGGCFWCIASVYYSVNGVIDVVSGFSGGNEENPTYDNVKHQKTSHRETIKIVFDDSKISLLQLLEIYYQNVDPFDEAGQFVDRGRSYTLAIYYNDNNDKEFIEKFINDKQTQASKRICIAIEKFKCFYNAEEYHQHYSEKHPEDFEKELLESGRKNKVI